MTAMTLKTSEGAVVTDPGEKAEVFNNFFSDVFTSDNGTCPSVVERIGGDGLSTVTFTPNLIRQVLKKLKPSMSTGWAGIPNMFLKKCANTVAYPVSYIFLAHPF